MFNILIVDDEPEQVKVFAQILEQEEYRVKLAKDEFEALYELEQSQPDLVILDIGFGSDKRKGLDILKRFRAQDRKIPIIMLTSLTDERLDPLSYDLDADDFVSKSVSTKSLLARVKRCLRRDKPGLEVIDGYLEVDRLNQSVRRRTGDEWEKVPLEPKEFELLDKLVSRRGQVIVREVLESLFPNAENPAGTVRSYICKLRTWLEPVPRKPKYILTVRNVGYLFEDWG